MTDGEMLGAFEGNGDGLNVVGVQVELYGAPVGRLLGINEGRSLGKAEGINVGCADGSNDGQEEGEAIGDMNG